MARNVETQTAAADEHDAIIDAIERRDQADAGRILREHLDHSRRRMSDYGVPKGLDVPLA